MSAMATDGATLDCLLNKLMTLPTVCPRKSWGHADGSSGSPLKFPGVERETKRVRITFELLPTWQQTCASKVKKGFVRECCLATRGVAKCRLLLRTTGFQPIASSPTQTVLSSELLLEVTRNKSRICIPPSAGGVFFKTYKWHLRAKPGAAHRLFHAIQKGNVFIVPTSLTIPLLL